jgi:predicted negative regulator of RcsB-dependent stress response
MKKIKEFVKENKKAVVYGFVIVTGAVLTVVAYNSDFMKGARELMTAADEGRLETDFK